ncbi:Taurine catabolism dioxygenase TauD, TfdA family [Geosmithia morbida]|uniref:Taurine catabolism dioxygenase TauD, TfdA family n=1 Tax=Geosmithia morbida TaxID=1094350 RepID=A0A9P4YWI7_9HYPO|nr:Taurine catabolism dioxygenase TauD, TfdA family [Geosmithia morbida]KAF4122339.1 Taurine catabolism dioxygenase TauD, TfdA family [Geosmithia morbida]
MAPAAVESATGASVTSLPIIKGGSSAAKLSGVLDQYEAFDVTPTIGREFPKANLAEWLNAPNSDELIRELAITISQRGVVFFRAQDDLTNELQKKLIIRLGELSGRPQSSGLHVHPVLNSEREDGGDDLEISTISSKQYKRLYHNTSDDGVVKRRPDTELWHSDIAFEPVPADYTSLRVVEFPPTGGGEFNLPTYSLPKDSVYPKQGAIVELTMGCADTLWASGYELYDRLSPAYQKFLESLTATFAQPFFEKMAKDKGFQLHSKPRGSPENVGEKLKAIHPVIRTNPVTGWKSIFPVGAHVSHINNVTSEESQNLLKWFYSLVQDHSVQVRLRWQNANDIAIWDNRSTFHTATYDYYSLGDRFGVRVVGVGERPFFDPQSKSRTEDLVEQERKSQS